MYLELQTGGELLLKVDDDGYTMPDESLAPVIDSNNMLQYLKYFIEFDNTPTLKDVILFLMKYKIHESVFPSLQQLIDAYELVSDKDYKSPTFTHIEIVRGIDISHGYSFIHSDISLGGTGTSFVNGHGHYSLCGVSLEKMLNLPIVLNKSIYSSNVPFSLFDFLKYMEYTFSYEFEIGKDCAYQENTNG